MRQKILLTGATGFVGSALLKELSCRPEIYVVAAVRSIKNNVNRAFYEVGDFGLPTDFSTVVNGVDVVIHAAGRAHVMVDQFADPLTEYRRVNVCGTLNLATQAAAAGVKRFIFISSVKVNGGATSIVRPFQLTDMPAPEDFYGISKMEAEQALIQLGVKTGMEVVIIRPPLIYGQGVKGNFASMANLVQKGLPLPLGAIYNKRSFVGIENLIDLIVCCVDHPAAANQVLFAGDGEDLSTTELLRCIGKAVGKPARLIPVPAKVLEIAAILFGKRAVAQRLLGSLRVDISKTCELLDWKPPYTVEEGLKRCFERSN